MTRTQLTLTDKGMKILLILIAAMICLPIASNIITTIVIIDFNITDSKYGYGNDVMNITEVITIVVLMFYLGLIFSPIINLKSIVTLGVKFE